MTSTLLWVLISIQIAMGAFDTFYDHRLGRYDHSLLRIVEPGV